MCFTVRGSPRPGAARVIRQILEETPPPAKKKGAVMPAIELRSSSVKGVFICAHVHCNVSPFNMVSSASQELN